MFFQESVKLKKKKRDFNPPDSSNSSQLLSSFCFIASQWLLDFANLWKSGDVLNAL